MEQLTAAANLGDAMEDAAFSLIGTCLDCEGFKQNKCAAAALAQKLGTIVWSGAVYTHAISMDATIMTRGIDDTIARLTDFETRVRSCTGWAHGRKAFTAGRSMVDSGNGLSVLYLDDATRAAAKLANKAIGWEATETTVVLQACANQRGELPPAPSVDKSDETDKGEFLANA